MIGGTVGGTIAVMLASLSSLLLFAGPPVLPEPTSPAPSEEVAPVAEEPPEPAVLDTPGPSPVAPEPAAAPVQQPSASAPVEPPQPVGPAESPQPVPVAEPAPAPPAPDPFAAQIDLPPSSRGPAGYVRVQRPRHNGTGMFIAAGATFAGAVLVQSIDSIIVGDGSFGILERVLLGTSMGLSAGGGINRGRADAYDDTALKRKRAETRKVLIAGSVLVGAGAVLGLVNEGMWWNCVFNGSGPYATENDPDEFTQFNCRYGLTRGLLDVSSGATAAGLGMLTWALVYRRHSRAYKAARVIGFRPTFGRGRAGIAMSGRF